MLDVAEHKCNTTTMSSCESAPKRSVLKILWIRGIGHLASVGGRTNFVGGCAAEHHDVQQGVGPQAVCPVHAGAGSLARGKQAGDEVVGLLRRGIDHLAVVVGGDAAHVVVHGG